MDTPKAMPEVGKKAPAFTLESDTGEKIRLSTLQGKPVLLFFYPKDNTPGCTVEAKEFRDALPQFKKMGIRVLGISPDTVKSHCNFIEKQSLNYTLLADPDKKAIEKYGLWVEKKLYGRVYWGVQRATFLIDAKGKIVATWTKVKPKGHAEKVLAEAKNVL